MSMNTTEQQVCAIIAQSGTALNAKSIAVKLYKTKEPDADQIRAVRNAFRRPVRDEVIKRGGGRGCYIPGTAEVPPRKAKKTKKAPAKKATKKVTPKKAAPKKAQSSKRSGPPRRRRPSPLLRKL